MTDNRDTGANRPTLGEVNHTNPYTGEVFGHTQTYSRGRIVAADGGKADASTDTDTGTTDTGTDTDTGTAADEEAAETESMAAVNHEPPHDAASANAAYQRGREDEV